MKTKRVMHSFLWLSLVWSLCMGIMFFTGAHAESSKKAIKRGPASFAPSQPYQPNWKENPKSFQFSEKKEPSAGPLQFKLQVRQSPILLPGEPPMSVPQSAQITGSN